MPQQRSIVVLKSARKIRQIEWLLLRLQQFDKFFNFRHMQSCVFYDLETVFVAGIASGFKMRQYLLQQFDNFLISDTGNGNAIYFTKAIYKTH